MTTEQQRNIEFHARCAVVGRRSKAAAADLLMGRQVAVAQDQGRHSIHAYFNTCPESPDGKHVLYFTSSTPDGEKGDIRILGRAAGKETILAKDITCEDAHRAACHYAEEVLGV